MARYTAFLDACVLVPVITCDTLLRLADSGAFRPLWSNKVEEEALQALVKIHPNIDQNRFLSRFRSMNESFEDAKVEGWEPLAHGLELPDMNDCHVVAAALRGNADAIVTENIRDFPKNIMQKLGLEVIRLDDFLLDQYDLNPDKTVEVLMEQRDAMIKPPITIEDFLTRISRSGAPNFASTISDSIQQS